MRQKGEKNENEQKQQMIKREPQRNQILCHKTQILKIPIYYIQEDKDNSEKYGRVPETIKI